MTTPGTIKESRLKSGTLTLGGQQFACQATNVTITPSYKEDGDPVETLCGASISAATTRTDTLKIEAIQDFTEPQGFAKWTWDNDLDEVQFTWKPNATGPTFTGKVLVRAMEIGGDINKRLTSGLEWDVVGATTWTPPA